MSDLQPWQRPMMASSQKPRADEDDTLKPWERPMLGHSDKIGRLKPMASKQPKIDRKDAELLKRVDCRFDSHPEIRFG